MAKKKFNLVVVDNQNNFQSRMSNRNINNDTRCFDADIFINASRNSINWAHDYLDTDITHYTQTMSRMHRYRMNSGRFSHIFTEAREMLRELKIDIGQEE